VLLGLFRQKRGQSASISGIPRSELFAIGDFISLPQALRHPQDPQDDLFMPEKPI
jgi:hypothetical protein